MKKEKNKLGFKKKLTKEELEELQAQQNAEVVINEADNQAVSSDVVALAPHYAEATTVATDVTPTATESSSGGIGSIALGVLALGAVGAAAGGGGGSSGGGSNTPTDTIAPTATITLSDTAITTGETSTVTITFSEAVTGVELSDFTAQNGTLSNLSTTDNITYTALFTPNTQINDTSNVITLIANSYKDNASNDGSSATSGNYTVNTTTDTVAPTTTLSNDNIGETVENKGTIALSYTNPAGQKVGELTSDESNVTYAIATNSNFELRSENGITSVYVKAGVVLDYETQTSYDIDITSTDASNNARTQTFTINVTDYTGNYTGTTGDDWIGGTSEVDTINGNDGNDKIAGGNGNDTINGGNGSDTAWYDDTFAITTGVTVDLTTSSATDQYGSIDTLVSIENIFGSSFDDVITGNAGNNTLDGWLGNDTIIGGDGNDIIIGGMQTDIDTMTGGLGSDTFKYLTSSHGEFTSDSDLTLANIDTIIDFTTNLDAVFDTGEDILDFREFLSQDATYPVDTAYSANVAGYFQVNANGDLWVDRDGYDQNIYNPSYVVNVGQQWSTDDIINLINAGQILV